MIRRACVKSPLISLYGMVCFHSGTVDDRLLCGEPLVQLLQRYRPARETDRTVRHTHAAAERYPRGGVQPMPNGPGIAQRHDVQRDAFR